MADHHQMTARWKTMRGVITLADNTKTDEILIGMVYDKCYLQGQMIAEDIVRLLKGGLIIPKERDGFVDYMSSVHLLGMKDGILEKLTQLASVTRSDTPMPTVPIGEGTAPSGLINLPNPASMTTAGSPTVPTPTTAVPIPTMVVEPIPEPITPVVIEPPVEEQAEASPPTVPIEELPPTDKDDPELMVISEEPENVEEEGEEEEAVEEVSEAPLKKNKHTEPYYSDDSEVPGNYIVDCACGCGEKMWKMSRYGYPRKYINKHCWKRKDNPIIKCQCGCGQELTQWNIKTGKKRRYINGHAGKKHLKPMQSTRVNYEITCACGCGGVLTKYNKYGRERKFLPGHGGIQFLKNQKMKYPTLVEPPRNNGTAE